MSITYLKAFLERGTGRKLPLQLSSGGDLGPPNTIGFVTLFFFFYNIILHEQKLMLIINFHALPSAKDFPYQSNAVGCYGLNLVYSSLNYC